jgi:uncharacterized damage-inducible protein DinB
MKEIFTMFAKHNKEADKAFLAVLNRLSNEEREKARGSYYKSLSGLAAHIMGGTLFFLGMFREAAGKNAAALKALCPLEKITAPGGKLTPAQWKKFAADLGTVDDAYVKFVSALSEAEFKIQMKTDWYNGKPASVPLYFMLGQLVSHGTHHRGQISQILDKLKIDNDWSGIGPAALS